MASGAGSQPSRISPRKFSEKIALLNKKEREANAEFEEIIKEVHATRDQQQQQPNQTVQEGSDRAPRSNNDPSGLSDIQTELQSLSESTNYKAAHADSLEEIERVYENLIKSVGQFDENEYQRQRSREQSQVSHGNPAENKSTPIHYRNEDVSGPVFRSSSAGQHIITDYPIGVDTSTATLIPSRQLYRQETSNINYQTDTDLKISQRRHVDSQPVYDPYEPPSSSSFMNDISEHDAQEVCVSTSCLPTRQQPFQDLAPNNGIAQLNSNNRVRVVSIGSASRNKYPCIDSYQSGYPNDVGQLQYQSYLEASNNSGPQRQHHRPKQFLKEPSGDRSRQKSISDPQLHVSPDEQRAITGTAVDCKSDIHSTAAIEQTFDPRTSCQLGISDRNSYAQNQRSQRATNTISLINHDNSIYDGKGVDYSGICSAHADPSNYMINLGDDQRQLDISQMNCFYDQSSSHGHQNFALCDTTTNISCSQLPGIKICTIDDETNLAAKQLPRQVESPANNYCDTSTSEHSSRNSSLPDISNLKFGSNSADASPKKAQAYQKEHWQRQDENGQAAMDFQVAGGDWSAYGPENVDMEVQMDPFQNATDYNQAPQQFVNQQSSANDDLGGLVMAECHGYGDGTFAQPVARVNNALSNSDCGFSTSPYHHQQGRLMICTSSDLYNNIMRSRSHNNISSMNRRGPKRPHNYSANALQQFESRHHTSQYCLQTDQHLPPVMNVRRISELKTHGTSTSPLDSSSNLNSPQSEMNSPGSSTTEQCDPATMFVASNHREHFLAANLPSGSSSTLVPDGMQLHSQHEGNTISESPVDCQRQQVPQTSMFVDEPTDCLDSLELMTYQSRQIGISHGSPPLQDHCEQPSDITYQQDRYKRTFKSPSSTTNPNDSIAMNNETGQSR